MRKQNKCENGFSLVEVLVALAILGTSLFFTVELSTVNQEVTRKTEVAAASSYAEDFFLNTVEILGARLRADGCSQANLENYAEQIFGDFRNVDQTQIEKITEAELSLLPEDNAMRQRCRGNGLRLRNRGFTVCRKITYKAPRRDSGPTLDNAIIIDGVFLFKENNRARNCQNLEIDWGELKVLNESYCTNPNSAQCRIMKLDDKITEIVGGDFFYNIAFTNSYSKRSGSRKKYRIDRRRSYLRSDKLVLQQILEMELAE